MARFIKQSEFDAMKAKSDEIKKEHGLKTLKDEIEYAFSQSGIPFVDSLIVIPDEEWEKTTSDKSDWTAAFECLFCM